MSQARVHARRPKGAGFSIDEIPWRPNVGVNYEDFDLDEGLVHCWPMVYILRNDAEAYIGQTTSVIRRMGQHAVNPEKSAFNRADVIYNSEFNASAITSYESRLIQLMDADGVFRITNKIEGMENLDYFSREEYDEMFNELWEELRRHDLVRGTIGDIEETELFKYSPYKALTDDQHVALEKILGIIENDHNQGKPEPLVVRGMPGTGKTVLAIYLLKMLKDDDKYKDLKVKLVISPTALRSSIQDVFSRVSNLDRNDVIGPADLAKEKYGYVPGKKSFDILLVDEAHRLHQRKNIVNYKTMDDVNRKLGLPEGSSELDWILDQAKLPIFFYDEMQVIGPSGTGRELMDSLLGRAMEHPIELDSQMRVKAGKRYLTYVADILANRSPSRQSFGDDYPFALYENFGDFNDKFEEVWSRHSLSRMVAGFAWPWITKNGKPGYDIEIDGVAKRWNASQVNWVGRGMGESDKALGFAHEIGCIHSIQGYDLSYVFVILGNDITFDTESGRIEVDPASYFDRNGKNSATPEELLGYIRNIYYVLLTRGVMGTYVYVCDKALREHLKRYIRVA